MGKINGALENQKRAGSVSDRLSSRQHYPFPPFSRASHSMCVRTRWLDWRRVYVGTCGQKDLVRTRPKECFESLDQSWRICPKWIRSGEGLHHHSRGGCREGTHHYVRGRRRKQSLCSRWHRCSPNQLLNPIVTSVFRHVSRSRVQGTRDAARDERSG